MATLVSPGVSISVTDESAYGTSGPGTVPLIVIATQANKTQPGTVNTTSPVIAPGTNPANNGQLWLITSQQNVVQTFGNPIFYSTSGTQQFDNELNETGLFTLYQYMGISSQAYVLRADIDLAQLIPTTTQPSGPPTNGQNWLNLSSSTWGLFRSNGNINPAFTWVPQSPLIISSTANLQTLIQGSAATPIISASETIIGVAGNLVINGTSISITTSDTITSIASKINTNTVLGLSNITANIYIRSQKVSLTSSTVSDVFSLQIICSNLSQSIGLVGSTPGILNDLGLAADPTPTFVPIPTFGTSATLAGQYAINTLAEADGTFENTIWESITLTTSTGTADYWFKVGSTDTTNPGWGWQEAVPTVIQGTVANPVFTPGQQFTITIGAGSPLTVTVPGGGALTSLVNSINTQLNSGGGTNAVASITTIGNLNYLTITNYDGTQILLVDVSDQNGTIKPLEIAGILPTNTYWASVIGTVSNPTFTAATLLTQSATVAVLGSSGTFEVGDTLSVSGGTASQASILSVASVQLRTATASTAGTGYAVNDTVTFSGSGYTTSVILTVTSINGGGGITGVNITQAGQYTGTPSPTGPLAPTSTSGGGTSSQFTLTWGVNTVTVSTPGDYTIYPTNPVSTTGGSGGGATFNLTPGFLTSSSFSVNAGSGAVVVHIPASPNNTLTGVINQINNVGFPSGPIVASATSNNQLVLTNTNGTSFTVQDLSGTPLNSSGIYAGVTFGRKLIYQGYQPALVVPNVLPNMAATNLWINTTPGDRGSNYVVETYNSGTGVWTVQNTSPNTGTVPMYSSSTIADAAFGALKTIGTKYINYNNYGTSPPSAAQEIMIWNGLAWVPLVYTPSLTTPVGPPLNGTYWFNPSLSVDIMVNSGTQWLGYRNAYPATDPNGVIISSVQPSSQSTGAALVDYDLWLDSDITPYPVLYRYNALTSSWILIDNTDDVDSAGIIFADARANVDGTVNGSTLPSKMVLSNYVDLDAPNALLYPGGILLFDTRYSTNNVKIFEQNYFPTLANPSRWVTASGNQTTGAPYMGSAAQRIIVVESLKSAIESNTNIRAEVNFFNLIATPGYTECLEDMINLNVDINQVAFVVGDTPKNLAATGTAIVNWATNAANVTDNGDNGLITHDDYAALWYPWGLGTNLDGTSVLVSPSSMALQTIAFSDAVSYQWFPPAGYNRGLVTSATSVGYLNAQGQYIPVSLNQGQRDTLYTNSINPIANFPNVGLVIFGQKTLDPLSTALDRINVARLICYLNYNLSNLAKPFLFELNDNQTRSNVSNVFNAYMTNLQAQRAVYDFSVVCDSSNNTPTTIDMNQLWISIAIQPEKAIEFIYIPIVIQATGAPLPGGTSSSTNTPVS